MFRLKRMTLFGTITSVLVMIQMLVIFRLTNRVAILENSNYRIVPQSTATMGTTNITAFTLAIEKSTEILTPTTETDNADRITKMTTPKPEQKVILLAGPHKTGSTSIQTNLFNWLHNNTHPSKLSQFWSWPSPVEQLKRAGCNETFKGMPFHAIIYQWTRAMRGPELAKRYIIKCMFSRDGQQLYSIPQYLAFYEKEFHHIWMRGRGIVIASEALDFIGAPQAGEMVLERTIRQFPWRTDYVPAANGTDFGNIIAVVTYRSPRSSHLQSMWHECCMEHESFRDYLLSFTETITMHHLDSLNLAYKFLERGIKTILIDLAGVLEKGYDLSYVVACDILGAACTPEKHFFGDETRESPIIANAKSKKHTVTLEQMELIDEAIEDYECNFLLMLGHRDLTILYPFALKRLVEKCRGMSSQSILEIKSLKLKIVEIAKQS